MCSDSVRSRCDAFVFKLIGPQRAVATTRGAAARCGPIRVSLQSAIELHRSDKNLGSFPFPLEFAEPQMFSVWRRKRLNTFLQLGGENPLLVRGTAVHLQLQSDYGRPRVMPSDPAMSGRT